MSASPVNIVSSAAHKIAEHPAEETVIAGFDGFVDEIIQVVNQRPAPDHFEPIKTIAALGDRIRNYAGKSGNIELVTRQVKLGGNGPIMANALIAQGYPTHYIGALGEEAIHPVFQEFSGACASVISLSEPAHTDALEFEDGKIMLGKMSMLRLINWERLLERVPKKELRSLLASASLLACTNWTMLPDMNGILEGIHRVLAKIQTGPYIFVDLADPKKRSHEDITGVLKIVSELQKNARMILGLNENESIQIATELFGREIDDLTARAQQIREALNVHLVVIHPTRSACVASATETAFLEGPFTPKPRLTTGAGDNFNAGFCAGLLSGLAPSECLASGVCSSGFYVRNCRSPRREELIDFMWKWANEGCGELW